MTRRWGRGFTLIELTAVMVIIAIVLVTIIPNLDNVAPSYRMSSHARRVASNIEFAHSEAIAQRKEFVVAYDLDQNTYWVIAPEPEDEDEEEEEEDPLKAGAEKLTRPADDLEHGTRPPDPEEDPDEDKEDDFDNRNPLQPTALPVGVDFVQVVVGDKTRQNGRVFVKFSHQGSDGGHVVGLRLVQENGAAAESGEQIWVKFNPITRTITYTEQQPESAPSGSDE